MGFVAHKTRRLYPSDIYGSPDEPRHIHKANGCTDHSEDNCPDDHWLGGRPVSSHPHHVEFDGVTGRWGYTRLTDEEIADLALLAEYEADVREDQQQQADTRLKLLRDRAKDDPTFAALLEQLGLEER